MSIEYTFLALLCFAMIMEKQPTPENMLTTDSNCSTCLAILILSWDNLGEKYILSKLNNTIKNADELFEDLQFNKIPSLVEDLFLELSRFYIQVTREKISSGSKSERETVLSTISEVYYKTLLMLAPICPFISEEIYQKFKEFFRGKEFSKKSVHLCKLPKADLKFINKKLENQVEITKQVIVQGKIVKCKVTFYLIVE